MIECVESFVGIDIMGELIWLVERWFGVMESCIGEVKILDSYKGYVGIF